MPCLEYHYHMISLMPLKESEVLAMPENNIRQMDIPKRYSDYLGGSAIPLCDGLSSAASRIQVESSGVSNR